MVLFHVEHNHLPLATSLVDMLTLWNYEFYILIPLIVVLTAYIIGQWRINKRTKYGLKSWTPLALFFGGYAALLLALISPIDLYSQDLLFVHMTQHILILMVAVPLLLLSNPMAIYVWAMPRMFRGALIGIIGRRGIIRRIIPRGNVYVLVCWLTYTVVFLVWHTPTLYDRALNNSMVHDFEHLSMFAAAVFFWWPIIGPAPIRSYVTGGLKCIYILAALIQGIVLGAIITFANPPVYEHYGSSPQHWGITSEVSQQLGGIIMWIPGSMMYFIALFIVFYIWIGREERDIERWRLAEARRKKFLGIID